MFLTLLDLLAYVPLAMIQLYLGICRIHLAPSRVHPFAPRAQGFESY